MQKIAQRKRDEEDINVVLQTKQMPNHETQDENKQGL